MARKLRANEIDYHVTRVYHVVFRCVRSLHLLGGNDEQRKQRLLEYVALLAATLAVELAGFAVERPQRP